GMQHYRSHKDVTDLSALVREALDCKASPWRSSSLGKGKTMGLLFLNPSLRTRLSTQKAAFHLGMQTLVSNIESDGWGLETKTGVVMDGKAGEHVKEAAGVLGEYCDIIGIRS